MYQISNKEIEDIVEILQSRKYFRYHGKDQKGQCDLFEEEFSDYLGSSKSIILNSGTNALITALIALGVGPGDEVIIPSYTFVATAFSVLNVGAVPVVAEIDDTLTICVKDIEQKITSQTKAIIPVHIDGLICNMGEIIDIAQKNNLVVIEDCAQAIGGSYQGKKIGTIGDLGCFSLNVDKIITTGEGGIITTSDDELYQRAFCYHDSACQFGPTKKDSFTIETFAGATMRVSEITGVMARGQLRNLDSILSVLRRNKKLLRNALDDFPVVQAAGYCKIGDCAISAHLIFENPKEVISISKKLLQEGVIATPLSVRTAHFVWNWGNHLYSHKKSLSLEKYVGGHRYHKAMYLRTVDIISRTLRIEIPYTENEVSSYIQKVVNALSEFYGRV